MLNEQLPKYLRSENLPLDETTKKWQAQLLFNINEAMGEIDEYHIGLE
jgi:hypothetical protein